MSAARTILTVAAAVIVVPVAMRARDGGAARAVASLTPPVGAEEVRRADPAQVRAYLQAVRGSNSVQCEVVLSSFNAWGSSRAPDRDSVAWNVAMVIHREFDASELVADLVAALRSGDECVTRVAARLLGRSKLPAARSALLAALGEADPALRLLGAIGLGFTEDSLVSGPLVRALADRDERVRAAAAWALGAVNDD